MSVSDTTVRFNINFTYGASTYVENETITFNENAITSGETVTVHTDGITLNYAVKLVPSWDSMENVKNNNDIIFTDVNGTEHKSDRYTVTYEKDTEKNSWVRVYTLKDEIPAPSENRAFLSTDKGICTNKYFDTERYSFDTNAVAMQKFILIFLKMKKYHQH